MRRGYTPVELLVVIVILATFIGLLLLAVQAVRSSAARVQCLNKRKATGLAIRDYTGPHGAYPVRIRVGGEIVPLEAVP